MRYLVVLICMLLQGCFFFYIPGSVLSSLSGWNACAGENVQVGQRLKYVDGRMGTVERVSGRSERCQDGKIPILVEVKFDEGKSNVQEWEKR
jgi:hypothetical protein